MFLSHEERNIRWDSHYDPGVGRFLSEDPIGFNGQDTNLYRYVKNNPVLYVDPDGLEAIPNTDGPDGEDVIEERMSSDLPLEPVYPELYVAGALKLTRSGCWLRNYKSGGGGAGIDVFGKNRIRLDYHKFKGSGGKKLPHVDIPGKVKHWPWKK